MRIRRDRHNRPHPNGGCSKTNSHRLIRVEFRCRKARKSALSTGWHGSCSDTGTMPSQRRMTMLCPKSLVSAAAGLAASGLLMFATLAPAFVPAQGAEAKAEYATLCTDVMLGVTAACRVRVA
jgi:hypothetical protein